MHWGYFVADQPDFEQERNPINIEDLRRDSASMSRVESQQETTVVPEETPAREAIGQILRSWLPRTRQGIGAVQIPFPELPSDLELLVMNAGEGAFNWIRCHTADACAGWIFDCGTRNSGGRGLKLRRSIRQAAASMTAAPAVIIVSHYHIDHYLGLERLGAEISSRRLVERHRWRDEPMRIWIPRIDPYSMALYLRIVAFGTLLRKGRKVVHDPDVTKLLARQNLLSDDLRRWFPAYEIVEAGAGTESHCPMGKDGIDIRALTPPFFPRDRTHPLQEVAGPVRYLLRDEQTNSQVATVAYEILMSAQHAEGFRDFLHVEFPEQDLGQLFERFGPLVQEALGSEPDPEESYGQARDRLVLRLLLAATSFARDSAVQRIDVRLLPRFVRPLVSDWRRTTENAAHLFNIAATFGGAEGTRFLLTGDADPRLWPEILSQTAGQHFAATQVPHHGSEHNVYWPAYASLDCHNFAVSADRFLSWRHPSRLLAAMLAEGTAVRGQQGNLYCTNRHRNCEIAGTTCLQTEQRAAWDAISFTSSGREWICDGDRVVAEACPFV